LPGILSALHFYWWSFHEAVQKKLTKSTGGTHVGLAERRCFSIFLLHADVGLGVGALPEVTGAETQKRLPFQVASFLDSAKSKPLLALINCSGFSRR